MSHNRTGKQKKRKQKNKNKIPETPSWQRPGTTIDLCVWVVWRVVSYGYLVGAKNASYGLLLLHRRYFRAVAGPGVAIAVLGLEITFSRFLNRENVLLAGVSDDGVLEFQAAEAVWISGLASWREWIHMAVM